MVRGHVEFIHDVSRFAHLKHSDICCVGVVDLQCFSSRWTQDSSTLPLTSLVRYRIPIRRRNRRSAFRMMDASSCRENVARKASRLPASSTLAGFCVSEVSVSSITALLCSSSSFEFVETSVIASFSRPSISITRDLMVFTTRVGSSGSKRRSDASPVRLIRHGQRKLRSEKEPYIDVDMKCIRIPPRTGSILPAQE